MERCPSCNGKVWDNTKKNEERKRLGEKLMPDFSCRDKECGWKQWPERPPAPTTPEEDHLKSIQKETPSIKAMYDKEVKKEPKKEEKIELKMPDKSTADQDLWELYFQRIELILTLFKEKGIMSQDAALAGCILGLRELMLNKRF